MVLGINLRGDDLGFAIVLVADPAVLAVPVFGGRGAVVEFHFQIHGESKLALALDGDVGAVNLVLIFILAEL